MEDQASKKKAWEDQETRRRRGEEEERRQQWNDQENVKTTMPTASAGPSPIQQTSTPVDMYMPPGRGRGRPSPGWHVNHAGMVGRPSNAGPREDTSQDARIAQQMANEPVEMDTRYDAQMAEHIQIQMTDGEAQWQAEEQNLQRGSVKGAIYTPKDPRSRPSDRRLKKIPEETKLPTLRPVGEEEERRGPGQTGSVYYTPPQSPGAGDGNPRTPPQSPADPRRIPSDGRQTGQTPFNSPAYYTARQTPYQANSTSGSERRRGPRPKFNLRTFGRDPLYTIEEFVATMNDYVTSFGDCEEEAVASIKSYLTGEASALVIDSGAREWEEIREVLIRHYVPPGHEKTHQAALTSMRLLKGETPTSLSVRVKTTMRKAFPTLDRRNRDPLMGNTFLQALGDEDITRAVLAQNIESFEEVVQLASRMTLAGITCSSRPRSKPSLLHFRDRRDDDESEQGTIARISQIVVSKVDDVMKNRPWENRSRSRDNRSSSNGQSMTPNTNRSTGSGSNGYQNNGGNRNRTPSAGRRPPYSGGDGAARPRSTSRSGACYKCRGKGHYIANCPSEDWYNLDGTIDVERTRIENEKKAKDPNGQGTPDQPR